MDVGRQPHRPRPRACGCRPRTPPCRLHG